MFCTNLFLYESFSIVVISFYCHKSPQFRIRNHIDEWIFVLVWKIVALKTFDTPGSYHIKSDKTWIILTSKILFAEWIVHDISCNLIQLRFSSVVWMVSINHGKIIITIHNNLLLIRIFFNYEKKINYHQF